MQVLPTKSANDLNGHGSDFNSISFGVLPDRSIARALSDASESGFSFCPEPTLLSNLPRAPLDRRLRRFRQKGAGDPLGFADWVGGGHQRDFPICLFGLSSTG
jgi:hypothetical protein